jgi:hypothetical protein
LISVEDEVDSRIDILVTHAGKLRNVTPPLGGIVAEKVVALAGEWVGARDARLRIRAGELHLERFEPRSIFTVLCFTFLFLPVFFRQRTKRYDCAFRSEKEAISGSVGDKPGTSVGRIETRLTGIGFED